jgi:hypothetical protein
MYFARPLFRLAFGRSPDENYQSHAEVLQVDPVNLALSLRADLVWVGGRTLHQGAASRGVALMIGHDRPVTGFL